MAAGSVAFGKIPLGNNLARPVTAGEVDRIQQAIKTMAASIQSPSTPNVVTVSKDYQVQGTEDVLHVNAQAGPVRITLLNPSSANRPLTIKQVNLQAGKSQVNTVTVATRDGSNTIAGLPSIDLDDTGTGAVSITADNQQHWPATSSGGNPPGPAPGGLVYVGIPPIYVAGNTIGIKLPPAPPAPPAATPWVAPIAFGDAMVGDHTGTETWQAESMVDFTGASSSLTIYWWFQSLSTAGTATFNLRVGGTAYRAINGAVVASWPEPSATMTARSVVVPGYSPPSGPQRVTITAQSSGSGQTGQIQGVNLIFR